MWLSDAAEKKKIWIQKFVYNGAPVSMLIIPLILIVSCTITRNNTDTMDWIFKTSPVISVDGNGFFHLSFSVAEILIALFFLWLNFFLADHYIFFSATRTSWKLFFAVFFHSLLFCFSYGQAIWLLALGTTELIFTIRQASSSMAFRHRFDLVSYTFCGAVNELSPQMKRNQMVSLRRISILIDDSRWYTIVFNWIFIARWENTPPKPWFCQNDELYVSLLLLYLTGEATINIDSPQVWSQNLSPWALTPNWALPRRGGKLHRITAGISSDLKNTILRLSVPVSFIWWMPPKRR